MCGVRMQTSPVGGLNRSPPDETAAIKPDEQNMVHSKWFGRVVYGASTMYL